MSADTGTVERLTRDIARGIHDVTGVERAIERSLAAQQEALSKGEAARVHALNLELDGRLGDLREAGESLRADVSDLAHELGLSTSAPLAEVLRAHPDPERAAGLMTARNALSRTRRAVRAASSRNATMARASLDAIASVRGVLTRAVKGEGLAAAHALSRLDARA